MAGNLHPTQQNMETGTAPRSEVPRGSVTPEVQYQEHSLVRELPIVTQQSPENFFLTLNINTHRVNNGAENLQCTQLKRFMTE